MSLWKNEGKTNAHDVMGQRISSGTLGGEHVVASSISGKNITQNIKPFDPQMRFFGTWLVGTSQQSTYSFSQYMYSTAPGDYFTVHFTGKTVALHGSMGPNRGKMDITIDGEAVEGRTNTMTTIVGNVSPTLSDTDDGSAVYQWSDSATTLPVVSTTGFPSSGTLQIDNEQMTYTSTDATNFYGLTRGVNDTIVSEHKPGSTIFYMSSVVDMYLANRTFRGVLWAVDNLSDDPHVMQVTMRSDKNASSSDYRCYFESVLVNGIQGAGNIETYIETANLPAFTTDGSGKYSFGAGTLAIASQFSDLQLIGILGLYDASNRFTHQWDPVNSNIILMGGAASTSYSAGDVKITLVYLGRPI